MNLRQHVQILVDAAVIGVALGTGATIIILAVRFAFWL